MSIKDKYVKRYFFLSILFMVLFFVFWKLVPYGNNPVKDQQQFQNSVLKLDNSFDVCSQKVFQALEIDSLLSWDDLSSLVDKSQYITYIYKNNKLIFWNGNELSPEIFDTLQNDISDIRHYKNGWFFIFSREHLGWKIINYKNIVKEYSFSNEYLKNENSGFFDLNEAPFLTKNDEGGFLIKNNTGEGIIYLNTNDIELVGGRLMTLLLLTFLLGWLWVALFVIHLQLGFFRSLNNSIITWFCIAASLFLLYGIIAVWGIPTVLKWSQYFALWHPLLPFIQSKGMVILFIEFILAFSFVFAKESYNVPSSKNSSVIKIAFIALINFLSLFALLYLFNKFYVFTLKPHDNAIGFLFRRDFIELFFISGIAISIYFIQNAFINFIRLNKQTITYYLVFTLIFTMVIFLLLRTQFLFYLALFFIQSLFILIVYYTPQDKTISFLRYLLLVVLLSVGFAVIINSSYSLLKNQFHVELIKKLMVNRDYDLEKKYDRIHKKIKQDKLVGIMLKDSVPEAGLINYLRKKYFNSSFKSYDIQLTICRAQDMLEIRPERNLVGCDDYFKGLLLNSGAYKLTSSLSLMNEQGESRYYLGQIELQNDSTGTTKLYVEMFSSIIPSGLGYPELLVNSNNQIDLSGYSVAKFHQNTLLYKMGEYNYHSSYSFMQQYPNSRFFYLNKYLHYKLRVNGSDILIVSRPVRSYAEQTATFSLLFILFSFLAILLYFFTVGIKQISSFKYSFRTRLQVFIMATLIILFVLLSAISGYYFNDIRQAYIMNQLNEKTKSVLIELQDKFSGSDFPKGIDKMYLQDQLQKFSIVFFTDINIYEKTGTLLATSRPRVFETGLLSTLINPDSYQQVMINKKLFYITEEHIGTLKYYSAYVPLVIDSGDAEGILNLPYFARQSEIKRSFLPMLYNFLNIFVIIGIFGTFLALIVAKLLTRPLAMLQQSLSEIRIDKKNEPLVWKNDDEIGHLIEEYNLMVKKLEESANLIKQSERESAWREVAQQVAHEIRNPLTPMKLNIQYLQKLYRDSKPDFDEKWKSLSLSLIDQIETLNEVAATFSDLARNSSAKKERIDILPLVISAVELYSNREKVQVTINTNLQQAMVLARQSELLRVFNNLIKNAVQSVIPQGGKVTISITKDGDYYEVRIEDTGGGIPADMKDKIFQPYFTTKSGGTGIGLAIVKTIVDEMNGQLFFESQSGKGSVFVVRLKEEK